MLWPWESTKNISRVIFNKILLGIAESPIQLGLVTDNLRHPLFKYNQISDVISSYNTAMEGSLPRPWMYIGQIPTERVYTQLNRNVG